MGKILEFVNNKEFICSVKPVLLVEYEYNDKLNNFIATFFESSNVLKLNNFGIKYASFAQVAIKNTEASETGQSNKEKKIRKESNSRNDIDRDKIIQK